MGQGDADRMECMEVWGGNQAVERSFQTPGLKVWVYSRPYGQARAGGDVYYLSSCASGRITRLLLADVSGHGETVSRVAIGLRDLMRRNVNFIKQTRFVQAMNQQFADMAEHGGFATALVGTFFSPTRRFALCNAGHPAPLLYRCGDSCWTELKNEAPSPKGIADVPLGIVGDANFGQVDVKLEPGDMLLSFSDAVIEARDAGGLPLGEAGVLKLVNGLAAGEPDRVIPALVERLAGLASDNLRQDDVTFLLCQATGGGPSLKNSLLAAFRLFRPVRDHTRLRHIG